MFFLICHLQKTATALKLWAHTQRKLELQEITLQPTIEITDLQTIKDATASLGRKAQKECNRV